MYVSYNEAWGVKIPLTRACAESKEVNQALVNHVWGVCDVWLAELIPQICPKSWPSMVERQNGPYGWSRPF
jgi:hypothetical protein